MQREKRGENRQRVSDEGLVTVWQEGRTDCIGETVEKVHLGSEKKMAINQFVKSDEIIFHMLKKKSVILLPILHNVCEEGWAFTVNK